MAIYPLVHIKLPQYYVYILVSPAQLHSVTQCSSQDLNCTYTDHLVMSLYVMPNNVHLTTNGWEMIMFYINNDCLMLHAAIHELSLQQHIVVETVSLLSIGSSQEIYLSNMVVQN